MVFLSFKYQGKFPEDRYLMQKEYIVPLYYMNVTTVPAKIRDFCNPFPMMRVKIFDSKKEMEANFFKLVTGKLSFVFIFIYNVPRVSFQRIITYLFTFFSSPSNAQ